MWGLVTMKRFVWLVAGLVVGCIPNQKPSETAAVVDTPQNSPALITAGQPTIPPGYFPASFTQTTVLCDPSDGMKPQTILNEFTNTWYTKHLSAAREPSIYEASTELQFSGGRILRFTLLPSFSHSIFVRIDAAEENPRLIATELTGTTGWDPGKIGRRIDRDLTKAEYTEIESTLSQSRIFDLAPIDCTLGFDGSRWIIEAADKAGYRFIDRWSPESGPVHKVGEMLLALTGWK